MYTPNTSPMLLFVSPLVKTRMTEPNSAHFDRSPESQNHPHLAQNHTCERSKRKTARPTVPRATSLLGHGAMRNTRSKSKVGILNPAARGPNHALHKLLPNGVLATCELCSGVPTSTSRAVAGGTLVNACSLYMWPAAARRATSRPFQSSIPHPERHPRPPKLGDEPRIGRPRAPKGGTEIP